VRAGAYGVGGDRGLGVCVALRVQVEAAPALALAWLGGQPVAVAGGEQVHEWPVLEVGEHGARDGPVVVDQLGPMDRGRRSIPYSLRSVNPISATSCGRIHGGGAVTDTETVFSAEFARA
jgi:hypothetical protein